MKARGWTPLWAASILWAGCKDEPRDASTAPTTGPERKPVVHVAPVRTKPFEEGYDAGFELGKKQATPQAKIPAPAAVQALAREQSAGHPERNERWERGFVEGYSDGFRNVVTGQK
jgi:hypothetical protein